MNSPMWVALGNHLWQSTLFALGVAAVTLLLRRNSANVRSSLWFIASLKFLVPFALLMALGAQIPWPSGATSATASAPGVIWSVREVVAPATQFASDSASAQAQLGADARWFDTVLPIVAFVWALGTLMFAARWLRAFMHLRSVLRRSKPTDIEFVIPVRSSASQIEPGVVGILRPVLLLPEGLEARLAPEQLRAVLAHERCHVARRDNLAAALHMLVEAVFWFHPLVWWLGARLVEERERACDEYVLNDGHAPESYAEGILKVCQHYVESRLPCVAGVGGADLKKRIEAIMKKPLIAKLSGARKAALAVVGSAAVAGPLLVGSLTATQVRAAAPGSETGAPELRNVSIELSGRRSGENARFTIGPHGNELRANELRMENLPLSSIIAFAYDTTEQQIIGPDSLKQPTYNITAETPAAPPHVPGMPDPNRPLIRKLLADQFGVVMQHERKTMDGYVLLIDSSGSKLKTHDGGSAHFMRMGMGSLEGTGVELELLRKTLSRLLDAPIVDQTGIAGTYDYKLAWNAEPDAPPKGPVNLAVEPAVLIKALKEQLGLHLEARPVTVDVIHVLSVKKSEAVVTKRVAAK